MPAHIVVVHDDPKFVASVCRALQDDGHDRVTALSDSMVALSVLEVAKALEVLITGTRFPPGKPTGISLALLTRRNRPNVKIRFVAPAEDQKHAARACRIFPAPVNIPYLVTIVRGLLKQD